MKAPFFGLSNPVGSMAFFDQPAKFFATKSQFTRFQNAAT